MFASLRDEAPIDMPFGVKNYKISSGDMKSIRRLNIPYLI